MYKKWIYTEILKYAILFLLFIIFIFMGGIQYYAMIRMGGFVLPMQKSEGFLSGAVLSEGVLS